MDEWKEWHSKVLEMVVEGKSVGEICLAVKRGAATVNKVISSVEFSRRLAEVKGVVTQSVKSTSLQAVDANEVQRARVEIEMSAVEAAKTVVWLSKNGEAEDKMRFEAAKEILDRAGVRAPEVVRERKEERVYAPEEIEKAKRILEESHAIMQRLSGSGNKFVIRGPEQ